MLDPFSLTLQGETIGILKRPRKPLEEGASKGEGRLRPFQKTTVRVQRVLFNKLEDARVALETATPIKVVITLSDSDKSETRLIKAMNICIQGKRISYDINNVSSFVAFNSISQWVSFMLMRDARVSQTYDLLPDSFSLVFPT